MAFGLVVVAVADFDALAEAEDLAVLVEEADEELLAEADALSVAHGVVLGDAVADWLAVIDAVAVESELWLVLAEAGTLAVGAGAPEALPAVDLVDEAAAVAVVVHVTLVEGPEAAAAGNDRTVP